MWDLGGEGVGSSASALQVATMCKDNAGPLVNKYLQDCGCSFPLHCHSGTCGDTLRTI